MDRGIRPCYSYQLLTYKPLHSEKKYVLFKRPLSNTPSTSSSRNQIVRCFIRPIRHNTLITIRSTIASHTGIIPIEQRGIDGVVGISTPVPVGLVAGIAAFFAEGFFVSPDVEAVGGEEVRLWVLVSGLGGWGSWG